MDNLKRRIAYDKVKRVIESCDTPAQLFVADNMISNFKNIYKDGIYSASLDLTYLEKSFDIIPETD